ncbi:hypothetical protein [Nostoc sp. T09]|nr:hypothetical protein [Nostoc sp. T09]
MFRDNEASQIPSLQYLAIDNQAIAYHQASILTQDGTLIQI